VSDQSPNNTAPTPSGGASSAEVHDMDSQGLIVLSTPHADEVLAELFSSNKEEAVAETEADPSRDSSITENAALATVFKKTRKNVNNQVGDCFPQRGGLVDSDRPVSKATCPTIVT